MSLDLLTFPIALQVYPHHLAVPAAQLLFPPGISFPLHFSSEVPFALEPSGTLPRTPTLGSVRPPPLFFLVILSYYQTVYVTLFLGFIISAFMKSVKAVRVCFVLRCILWPKRVVGPAWLRIHIWGRKEGGRGRGGMNGGVRKGESFPVPRIDWISMGNLSSASQQAWAVLSSGLLPRAGTLSSPTLHEA